MGFNPNDYMMKLKGKDYLPVQGRMVWYREDNKENTTVRVLDKQINLEKGFAYFELEITDSKGNTEVGVGSETAKDFGDYIEKAYTKAYGRALAQLGYGTQFAPEFEEGDRIVDSPRMGGGTSSSSTPRRTPAPAPAPSPAPAPANPDAITKEQMQKIAELMKAAGLDSVAMSIMTTELFSKGKAVELSNAEADKLIEALQNKVDNK